MPDKDVKRRLPVVQPPAEPAEEPRPAWHWVGFGAVAIFIVWLPLAYLAESLGRRLTAGTLGPAGDAHFSDLSRSERLAVLARLALPQAVALVLAAMAGGFLVTRFGQKTTSRDAAFAGLTVGALALGLTFSQAGFSLAGFVVPLVATGAAAAGGMLGRRRR
ncbi:MAG TPA: hypothetical protein VGH28_29805 [Polyangiaceae bacterium]